MENYENKYNNALEKLQEALAPKDGCEISGLTRACIEEIFPELKESEDERIRTAILNHLKKMWGNCKDDICGVHAEDAISWLEKQGEKSDKWKEGDVVRHGGILALVIKGRNAIKSNFERIIIQYPDEWVKVGQKEREYFFEKLEKQGEKPQGKTAFEAIKEKPTDNTNKVEPKFHEGEWIAREGLNTAKIISIEGDRYEVEFIDGNKDFAHIDYIDRIFHLWTIKDAKDGDVLISKAKHPFIFKNYDEDTDYVYAYCGITDLVKDNGFYINYEDDELWTMYCVNGDVLPATKEQRDLLFQKMREKGYKWDTKKKELKKSQRMISAEAKEALYGTCMDYEQKYKADVNSIIAWLEKQSNKSVNIDIESMVSAYKQKLKSQGGVENSPLVNMCLIAFREGVEEILEELNLKKFEKQGEKPQGNTVLETIKKEEVDNGKFE